ncbi:MAG: hypothetical protein IPH10_03800 [bacterium]|nr:hypothetical protein [bacterium]
MLPSFGSVVARNGQVIPPGALLCCCAVYGVCVTAANRWADLAILSAGLTASVLLLRMQWQNLIAGILSAKWLLVIAALIHAGFRLWFVTVEGSAVTDAATHTVFFLTRLVLLLVGFHVVLAQHSPAVFMEAVAKRMSWVFGQQLAGQTAQVSMLAFSMLPQLQMRLHQRRLARKLRGLRGGGFVGRVVDARGEFQSALRHALHYADTLAVVLWSRGYRPDRPLPNLWQGRGSATAYASVILFCILCLSTLLPAPKG